MADRQPNEKRPAAEGSGEWLRARIGVQVLRGLGEPDRFQAVQVRPLWAGHYRVNVLVGADTASATVAHSFFLEADGDGNVVASTPALTRRY
jgi:hypothetical protein